MRVGWAYSAKRGGRAGCVLFLCLSVASAGATQPDSVMIDPAAKAESRSAMGGEDGRTLVPLHSTIPAGGGRTRLDFSGVLSIHNPSSLYPLVVQRIEYRDSAGRLVRRHLEQAIALRPFASMQVVIPQQDVSGGIGPVFVVDWSKAAGGDEPMIEAVMLSIYGSLGFSLVSPGRRVSRP